MTLALDTQENMTHQPAEAAEVIDIVKKAQYKQTHIEEKPFKRLKYLVSSIPTSTIYLTHSEEEDERISPMPITMDDGTRNYLHDFINASNCKYSSPTPQP